MRNPFHNRPVKVGWWVVYQGKLARVIGLSRLRYNFYTIALGGKRGKQKTVCVTELR